MNASPEQSTALKASSTHLGAFPDTEKDRDGVEQSTTRTVSQACSKQFQALIT